MEMLSHDDFSWRSTQLQLLCACSGFLKAFIGASEANFLLPLTLKNTLTDVLLDISLSHWYPDVIETFMSFVQVRSMHWNFVLFFGRNC